MKKLSYVCALLIASAFTTGAYGQVVFTQPQPGDIYREYSRVMETSTDDWRVTDPNASHPGAAAFIPNPVLAIDIDDLQGAVRAELLIAMWGGHIGTTGKMVRFNGNSWITIPELNTTNGIPPGSDGQCHQSEQMNGVVIPIGHLVQGTNYFEGTSADQSCNGFGWGQWGWYGIILRVYYGPSKPHPTGQITSPASRGTMSEYPVVSASVSAGVDRVDFLAYYEGYDTDGDGIFTEYHHDYHRLRTESFMSIRNHVGTATGAPFQVVWNTQWVPDQPAGGIKILARMRDNTGMWYVTPEVTQLSLLRTGSSVRFYKPMNVPENFWVQSFAGDTKSSNFDIPAGTNLGDAVAARLLARTWNGINEFAVEPGFDSHWRKVNNWTAPVFGVGHYYSYDTVVVPTSDLIVGSNTVEFHANTEAHHGIEIMWPGPGMSVAYSGNYGSPLPSTVTLNSPANNATGQSFAPTLIWDTALVASSYRVQVATDSLFAGVVFDSTVNGTSLQVSPLANLTRHFWRVRAQNAVGNGSYSPVWNFTTFMAVPAAPALVAPINNAAGQAVSNLAFQWNALEGTDFYRFQLSEDSTFTGLLIKNDSSLVDTFRVVSGLSMNTRYFWRVNGRNGGGNGPFSPTWGFWTFAQLPAQVSVVSPAHQSIISADSVTFRWNSQPEADRYWHEIAIDSTFTFRMIDSTVTDTAKVARQLQNGQMYYWRVRAGNSGGWGPFSEVRSFSIVITGVHDQDHVPTSFSLSQNYPNPFNPSTRIEFGLPRESHVKLEVFTMLGERVATLIDDTRPAGMYSLQFNASDLGSGLYLYRLSTAETFLSKKMLLLK
jgi:hypothetical protein